ncbi:hypothetical protein QBC46DRAFT_395595 [Diplogelasinospora grovesii]|uniref:DUF7136 domain-containing protein n=1 Tax=Diplogelasinospora grovesii TaxID=303347 RepID=A0AAN6MZ49_9PEZI|nr:hypothetical protein QBC46DRAFT_395595 [Diplogelasinospora grovesii]
MNSRPTMVSFSLLALLPVALLWAVVVQAGATTFPATVEVDLIFPRNDTYAPSALFPIVFAFQNAALAPSLDPGFDLTLWAVSGLNTTGYSPALDLAATNFSGSDPTYVYTYVTHLNAADDGTAASYRLAWDFSAGNCSDQGGGALKFGGGFRNNSIEFTIQSGAQAPDLVAATASAAASCSNISHFAFNLTDTLNVALPAQYDSRNTCAVFSDVQPLVAGNPCAVQVGTATASSISAALTATACAAVSPVVSCPSTNAAPGGQDTGYTVVLGGIVAAFVAMHHL